MHYKYVYMHYKHIPFLQMLLFFYLYSNHLRKITTFNFVWMFAENFFKCDQLCQFV